MASKGKKKKLNNKKQKNNIFLLMIVFFLMILMFSLIAVTVNTYAMWNQTRTQNEKNLVAIGCFSITLDDQNNSNSSISLNNTYPISDNKGKNLLPYQFTITNTCDINANYKIVLSSLSNSTLNASYIKILFNNIDDVGTISLLSNKEIINLDNETLSKINAKNYPNSVNNSYLLENGSLASGESKTYDLRLWMSSTASNALMNKGFYGVISVTSVSAN